MSRKDAQAQAAQREWELGVDWARWLLAGNTPQPLGLYGIVLEPDEVAYLQTTAQYSRLYGGTGRYTHNSGFFIGKPGMVLGMMAANAAVNASRKAAAKRDMEPTWRDVLELPVVATNLRLLCNLPGKGWMSFYYSAVQEFYPDTANWMITFGFQNAVPLRLAGLATPTLAVLTSWCVHGYSRWQGEPGISPLIQAAIEPPPPTTITSTSTSTATGTATGDVPHDSGSDASTGSTGTPGSTGSTSSTGSTGDARADLIRAKLDPGNRR